MIKTCCNVDRLGLIRHIEHIYLATSIAIPRSLAGRHQLSLYHVHPQRGKRDYATLAILQGCGLRRAELTALRVEDMQQ